MRQVSQVFESLLSFVVFVVVTMAIAGMTYQLFNPDGGISQWVTQVWDTNPTLLFALGSIAVFVKRWLSGVQGAQAADLLFYGAILLGFYYGFNLLIAT